MTLSDAMVLYFVAVVALGVLVTIWLLSGD
jgi:hypothetical protein